MKNTRRIYPKHCNATKTAKGFMLHGGYALMWADQAAELCVSKFLSGYITEEKRPLTVSNSSQFFRGPSVGEIITISAKVVKTKNSRMDVEIIMTDEKDRFFFKGIFSFCYFEWSDQLQDYITTNLPADLQHIV